MSFWADTSRFLALLIGIEFLAIGFDNDGMKGALLNVIGVVGVLTYHRLVQNQIRDHRHD